MGRDKLVPPLVSDGASHRVLATSYNRNDVNAQL